ncbi:hypothetical protein BC829DRAFT_446504 [Chytridium lagenaria]|nr:hypothetical protein BC829DRAFT_446504 [Chytridium lagenaria]
MLLPHSSRAIALLSAHVVNAYPGGGTANLVGSPGLTVLTDTEVSQLRQLAQLSQLSYCSTEILDANSFKCNICNGPASNFTNYTPILSSNNATQGAVVQPNWIDAINFPVQNSTSPTLQPVSQSTKVSKTPTNPTTIPSPRHRHSYGCAISTLAVAELVLTKRIPAQQVRLTTMGCPRLGNFEFARLIDTQLGLLDVIRVTHSSDRISRVPPTTLGYRHAGRELFVDVEKKQMLSCMDVRAGLDESSSCNNRFDVTALGIAPHNSFFGNTQNTACRMVADGIAPVEVKYLPFEILTERV